MCSTNKPGNPKSSESDREGRRVTYLPCGAAKVRTTPPVSQSLEPRLKTPSKKRPDDVSLEPKSHVGHDSESSAKHDPPPEEKNHWIEIRLVLDQLKFPVANVKYKITDPENKVHEGTLDGKGRAKIKGLKAGDCKISFPELDKEVWEYVGVR